MLTSFYKIFQKAGFNPCSQMVATAIDIDAKCAHMCYLQMSLYGIPAVIIHGNTLTCQEYSRWYTPVYLLNGWIWREKCGITTKYCEADEKIKCALEPAYYAMRQVQALIAENAPAAKIPEKPTPKAHTIEIKPYDFGEQFNLFEGVE
jgi:hypothetical protein